MKVFHKKISSNPWDHKIDPEIPWDKSITKKDSLNKDLQSERYHILKFVNSNNILQDIVYAPKDPDLLLSLALIVAAVYIRVGGGGWG